VRSASQLKWERRARIAGRSVGGLVWTCRFDEDGTTLVMKVYERTKGHN